MKNLFLLIAVLIWRGSLLAQPLSWDELGADPAYCRLFGYQNGNGVVYAAATGGTAPISYQWVNLQTGVSTTNSVWGGLNPGLYKITATDATLATLVDTVEVDSINPVAGFDEVSGNVNPVSGGWVGFYYESVLFANTSTGFVNPNDPFSDTTFFWNFDSPGAAWQISHDYNEIFGANYFAGTYEVCLVALNKNGCSDTLCRQVHIFGPADIADESADMKFISVYSGHEQNMLYFNCGGFSENLNVEIFSVKGELITTFESNSGKTSVAFNSAPGVYLYTVKSQSSQEVVATGKLIH